MPVRHDGHRVSWLGYATTRIETPDGRVLYFDPGRYGVLDDYVGGDGDVVCITHDHHYDSAGIDRVSADEVTVVVYQGVDPDRIDRPVEGLDSLPGTVLEIGEEDRVTVSGFEIRSVPAYNEPDGPHVDDKGDPYHPPGFGVGYHVDTGDRTVFYPGDSDALDQHASLSTSLFLPPIGGSFTMDRHEAVDLAETIEPDLVLPVHYNTFEALMADPVAFAGETAERGVPVVLETPTQ